MDHSLPPSFEEILKRFLGPHNYYRKESPLGRVEEVLDRDE
jgi:hypothetical protein